MKTCVLFYYFFLRVLCSCVPVCDAPTCTHTHTHTQEARDPHVLREQEERKEAQSSLEGSRRIISAAVEEHAAGLNLSPGQVHISRQTDRERERERGREREREREREGGRERGRE